MGNVRAGDLFAAATHACEMTGSCRERIEMVEIDVKELLEVEDASGGVEEGSEVEVDMI